MARIRPELKHRAVLALTAAGWTARDIVEAVGLPPRTVHRYRTEAKLTALAVSDFYRRLRERRDQA